MIDFFKKEKFNCTMKNEIIIYQPFEESLRIEVNVEDDTVWLTQAQWLNFFSQQEAM